MLLFVAWRVKYVFVMRYLCDPLNDNLAPGECYWYKRPWSRYQIAIYLHMWSVFPGGLLAVAQFIPSIRARRPNVHRYLGYACWFFGMVAAVSGLMLYDRAFGGQLSTQVSVISLFATTIAGHYKAYRAIKRFQLDRHREWMLRTWIYMGSIITVRPLLFLVAIAISVMRKLGVPGADYYAAIELPCEQVFYFLNIGNNVGNVTRKPDFFSTYGASCTSNLTGLSSPFTTLNASTSSPLEGYGSIVSGAKALIHANLLDPRQDFKAAAIDVSFGPTFLLSLFIHVVLLELYFRRTPEEAERLKKLGEFRRRAKEQKLAKKSLVEAVERDASDDSDTTRAVKSYKAKSVKVEIRETEEEEERLSAQALAGDRPPPDGDA